MSNDLKPYDSKPRGSKHRDSKPHDSKPHDSEPRDLDGIIINALESVKGLDITSLDVTGLTDVMDTMVVVTGNTNRQVRALANAVTEDCKNAGFSSLGVEGDDVGEWVLVDMGDTVVHIMLPATRVFYDLEKLWSMRPADMLSSDSDQEQGIDTAGE